MGILRFYFAEYWTEFAKYFKKHGRRCCVRENFQISLCCLEASFDFFRFWCCEIAHRRFSSSENCYPDSFNWRFTKLYLKWLNFADLEAVALIGTDNFYFVYCWNTCSGCWMNLLKFVFELGARSGGFSGICYWTKNSFLPSFIII